MTNLEDHLMFLKKLRIPFKKQLLRYCYHLFTEHTFTPESLKAFIDEVMKP